MSAITSFILFPKALLPELQERATPKKSLFGRPKDTYRDLLRGSGREVTTYRWSGYVIVTLLSWLQEVRQIDLMKSGFDDLSLSLTKARGATHFILTNQQKLAYLDRLDPSAMSSNELRDYYNQFNDANEPDVGVPMIDGVRALRDALSVVDKESVILLSIG